MSDETRPTTAFDSPARSGRHGRFGRGYVLVMVLLVLAIAAAALAGACRMSLERALFAERAQEDLQRRWGVVTCRSVLLPKAEAVLSQGPPSSEARRELHLNGTTVTLVFGDEQAKANMNRLYRAGGLSAAERAARQLAQSPGLSVELRPLADAPASAGAGSNDRADPADPPPAFESFGQVFARARPADLVESRGAAPSVTAALTCWGDGSLNFRRASPEAVREVCAPFLPSAQISKMLDLRAKSAKSEVSDVLDQLNLTESARDRLDDLLVDDSTCHSLWVITRSGGRNGYDLAVSDESSSNSSQSGQPVLFSW
jgi:hypothetical protein